MKKIKLYFFNLLIICTFILSCSQIEKDVNSNNTSYRSKKIDIKSNYSLSIIVDTTFLNKHLTVFWNQNGFLVFSLYSGNVLKKDSLFFRIPIINEFSSNPYKESHKFIFSKNNGILNNFEVHSFNNKYTLVSIGDLLWRGNFFCIQELDNNLKISRYGFSTDKGLYVYGSYIGRFGKAYSCYDDMELCNYIDIYEFKLNDYHTPELVYKREFTYTKFPKLFNFENFENSEDCFSFFQESISEYLSNK